MIFGVSKNQAALIPLRSGIVQKTRYDDDAMMKPHARLGTTRFATQQNAQQNS